MGVSFLLEKRTMTLAILLVALFAITSVGAADNATEDITGLNDCEIITHDDNQLNLSDGEVGSFEELSYLINTSDDGDTIKLEKNYTGSGEIVIDRNIIIDGDGYSLDATSKSRIFSIENYNVVLKNITFINAKSGFGGAVYAGFNSNITIIDSTFINCSANFGGALTILSSNADITGCSFINNHATYDGGAIFSMYGILNLTDNTFTGNSANRAGAVYSSLNNLTLINNRFMNNQALNVGAIYAMTSKSKTVHGNVFSDNSGLNDFYETLNDNLTIFGDEYYYPFIYNDDYSDLPEYYDMRQYNLLSPVKDQGVEGNCWAFSAMAVLESCLLKASNTTFDLSESNLKNLMAYYSDWGHTFQTNGGGNMNMASGYFASWLGPVNEEDDPYSMNSMISPILKSILHIQNILFLKRTDYLDNDEFKHAILSYGPISVGMYYNKTYLNGYSYYYDGDEDSNHEVCIVGWNDDYSRDNFINAPGDGAWIVRNSWGPSWGDYGYFYVSYYDTGFAKVNQTDAYTFILNDTVKFNRVYQYESHLTSFSDDEVVCYKNIFTVEGEEYLAGVSTYFADKCDYELNVYLNDNVNPLSTKRGKTNAGYYTIILDSPVLLSKNDNVTVVFNCSNFSGGIGTIPLSFDIRNVNLYLEEGRSFYLSKNGYWVDLCTSSNAVACIKIFTTLSIDKKTSPYILINYNGDYQDNSILVNLNLPRDALGLLELNTSNSHYIINLSETHSIKLYNLTENNNTLTIKYFEDDRYLENIVNVTIPLSGNFNDLQSKISEIKEGGVLDLYMDYIFDSASDYEIDILNEITIDGHGHTISGSNLSVIFNVWGDNVILKNIKFRDGFYQDNGGAIYVNASNCQIINCSFINNVAYGSGGAIFWYGANGVIKDSYFENNTSNRGCALISFESISISNSMFVNNYGEGSTVFLFSGNNIISDSRFINNSNPQSRVLYIRDDNNTIYNSSFTHNYANEILYLYSNDNRIYDSDFADNSVVCTTVYIWGDNESMLNCSIVHSLSDTNSAAILFYGHGNVMDNCSFKNNIGGDIGGAISIIGNNCNLTNSRFINNTAQTYNAGALYLQGNNILIKNNTFNNNSANQSGAVFVNSNSGNVILSDSTFADNSANLGGAIIWSGSNGNLLNSTFINNSGNYQIYWANPDSGNIEGCKFPNSSKYNVRIGGATFIKNNLSMVTQHYIIEYKNPTNLSVSFNLADGVDVSSPITFTIEKNTYDLKMVNGSVVLCHELANLDVGDVTVMVNFEGDDTYNPFESNFTLTVTPVKSSLTLKSANTTVGHGTELAAYVNSDNVAITQGSVTFYDGENVIGSSEVQNGVATLEYTPTVSGIHSIRAVYSDENYESSNDTFILYVDSANVKLSLNSGVVGFKSSFSANVTALYSEISEGSVSFYVDNVLIDSVLLENGVATLKYTPMASGTHTVRAVYKSSDFSDAEDTVEFSVLKAASDIVVSSSNGKVGYASTITASVTSANGLVINEGSVTFYDNGNLIGSANVENGVLTLKYTPKTAGNHNISAVFNSDNFEKSSDYNMCNVSKSDVSIIINNAGTVSYLDTVSFSISVVSNGNPVSEGKAIFYIGDEIIAECDVSNGASSCSYNVGGIETFNLRVVYPETDNYLGFNVTKTFSVNKMSTSLIANAITVVYDVTGNLVVSLRDKNGKAISGAYLSVSFNGQKTFITDKNGQIILSSAGLAPNTYNIVVTYPGEGGYGPSSTATQISVKKATPKITAAKKTFKRKLKVKKYSVSLKTHLNKAMAKVTLSIKISGKTYSAKTNAKGKATFKIKKLTKKGNFNAVITFKGNAYYNKVTKTVKIKIK